MTIIDNLYMSFVTLNIITGFKKYLQCTIPSCSMAQHFIETIIFFPKNSDFDMEISQCLEVYLRYIIILTITVKKIDVR